jgi:recombination protein RecA
MSAKRDAAFEKFQASYAKSFGEGRLRPASEISDGYEVVSTGSLALDYALGVGGYIEGRLTEIWGVDAIGKTTLALLGIAEFQRKYPQARAAFIDMEGTFDKGLAIGCGVDLDRLWIDEPDSAEEVADAMKKMLMDGVFRFIVLDSIGAMIPEAEKEKDADQAVMANQAKIVTRMVKIAAVEARHAKAVVLLINQVRANLSYGADITTGGGFALKHCTTHKIKLKRTGTAPYTVQVDGEKHYVGHELAAEVERNKVAPPRKVAFINLFNQPSERYGPRGLDKADEAFTLGTRRDVAMIEQSGSWYTIRTTGERANGKDAAVDALRADPDSVTKIRDAALASLRGEVIASEEADPAIDAEIEQVGDDA